MTLGQGHHGVPRAVAVDAGADHEGRPRAGIERGADARQHLRVGTRRGKNRTPRADPQVLARIGAALDACARPAFVIGAGVDRDGAR